MGQSDHSSESTPEKLFSNTLSKLTDKANSFGHHHRVTATTLPSSDSSGSVSPPRSCQSHLPRPSGIPRSSSFFGNLNALVMPNSNEDSSQNKSNAISAKRYRKISDKFIQLPFFSRENQLQSPQRPLSPRTKRETCIKIEHRGLMAPIQPASMPRSSTVSNLTGQHGIVGPPSFMRPTSSSANRRRQSESLFQHLKPALPRNTSSSRALLQAPVERVSHHGYRRQSLRSPPPRKWETSLPVLSSTKCFPIRKDSFARHSSPPARTVAPAIKPPSISYKEATTNQRTFPRPPNMPLAPHISITPDSRLTPEYEDFEESKRDKQAVYIEPQQNLDEDDGSEVTATEESEYAEMLFRVACNRSVLDEENHQHKHFQHQTQADFEEQDIIDDSDKCNIIQALAETENLCYIHEAQPPPFWLGRLTSLSDHLRTEILASPPQPLSFSPPFSSYTNTTRHGSPSVGILDNARRNTWIFNHLHSLCITPEARGSLDQFKMEFEAKYGVDGVSRRGKERVVSTSSSTMLLGKDEGGGGKGEKEGGGRKWLSAFKGRNRV